jgi:hypothetical protein
MAWMTPSPQQTATLERELRAIFSNRLQSLVAYGLHASAPRHAPDGRHVDLPDFAQIKTLAIVETLTAADLLQCAEHAARWHDRGLATPLLLTAHEFERSLDAFPLEFGAILADHAVLAGPSPFDGLRVNASDVRRACEVQARSHLLHLREAYVEAGARADALAELVVRSAAPLAALLASIARLQGLEGGDPAAAGRHAEHLLNLPAGVLAEVVRLASTREISSADAARIFPSYLHAVERLVEYVDGWRQG